MTARSHTRLRNNEKRRHRIALLKRNERIARTQGDQAQDRRIPDHALEEWFRGIGTEQ